MELIVSCVYGNHVADFVDVTRNLLRGDRDGLERGRCKHKVRQETITLIKERRYVVGANSSRLIGIT